MQASRDERIAALPGIGIWLFQLVFPTTGLTLVLDRPAGQRAPGIYTLTLVGLVVAWYLACCSALGFAGMRRWIQAHRIQLVTLYASTMMGMVVIELYFRYQVKSAWAKMHRDIAPTEYSRELGWRLISGRQGVGEHGWRGPSRTNAKADGRYRIVCLGDSTTHGYRCRWEEAWPCQLESLLNADAGWTSKHGLAEVLNLGVPAFGTDQELLALKSYGLSYQPDLVILHLCTNDFADVSYDHDWRMPAYVTRYKPLFALEQGRLIMRLDFAPLPRHHSGSVYKIGDGPSFGWSSALLPEVGRFLVTSDSGIGWDENRWPIREEFRTEYARSRPLLWALVSEMARISERAGSRFLVTLSPAHMNAAIDQPPFRVGSFLREYQSDAAAAGVTAIHCIAEFFQEDGNRRFLSDQYHLNALGNALVARHIMSWLKVNEPHDKPHDSGLAAARPR